MAKKKVVTQRPVKVTTILNVIDRFLADENRQQDGSAAKLWNILTALRGPDEQTLDAHSQKMASTVTVRQSAFPLAAESRFVTAFMVSMSPMIAQPPEIEELSQHFKDHHQSAVIALKALGR